ncbi:TonB-dependent receptor [Aquimarina sp. RZ0]|uniref:TonB-dependent receptor n=1 Tax=Aquimarina sp. RZ0 TaxID=2607730 RepID=UPI00165EC21A|nr:TonB-dependent receptor [Aquimarina sp. RZ0]
MKNKRIKISGRLLLQDILQKIQSQTSLFFEKINDRYYIIRDKTQNKNQVCGILIDGETGIPLEGASIKKMSNGSVVTTDDRGYFYLHSKNSQQDTVNIRFLGYNTQKYLINELSEKQCKKIYLYQNNQQLEEVLIQEYVTQGFSKEKLSGAVIFDPNKLSLLPRLIEPDILKSVQFLPGVESTTEKASELFIRGSNSDQNLILWDGIKVYNSGHFFNLLSAFNPYVTESVKVSRGFSPLQYDSRIGGIIDISSKSSIPKDFGIGIGSNLTHADVYAEVPLGKKVGLVVSGRRSITDIVDTPTTENYNKRVFNNRFSGFSIEEAFIPDDIIIEDNSIGYQDYTAKIIPDFSSTNKLSISGFYHENHSDNNFYLDSGDFLSSPFFEFTEQNTLNNQNFGFGINWVKEWGTDLSMTASSYYTDVNQQYTDFFQEFSIDEGLELTSRTKLKNDLQDFGASTRLNWQFHKKHQLAIGYHFSRVRIQGNLANIVNDFIVDIESFVENNQKGKNTTQAAYIEDIFKINKKISLNIGVKGNYFSTIDDFYIEPRIGITFSLANNINANILAERKHQVIDQVVVPLSSLFLVDFNTWRLRSQSDLDQQPIIISDQISTNFTWNQKNWLIELEGYYKKGEGIDDISNAIGDNDISGFGTSSTFGVDVLIKRKINHYSTWLTYSYIDQEFRFDNFKQRKPFPGFLDITHNLSWIHSYLLGNLEFSLGWNIRTGRPYTPVEGTIVDEEGVTVLLFGDVNSKRLEPYHRLDFSTSYRFNLAKDSKWRGRIALSIINAYNRENILDRRSSLVNRNDDSKGLDFDVTSLGFTPNISFRIDF